MKIHWNNSSELQIPTLPKLVEVDIQWRKAILSRWEITRCVEFLRNDLWLTGHVFTYAMYSSDGKLWFHLIINPDNKTIYIPPAALITHTSLTGWWSTLQQLFEKIAARNNYTLIACIAASEITWFSQRVVDTLRREWYYLTPPVWEKWNRVYGIHQSGYLGSGFQELWIDDVDMMEPTTIW